MPESEINTLKLAIIEERALTALHELGARRLPLKDYLDECLDRLCQGTPYLKPLPGACFFQRRFTMDSTAWTLVAWRELGDDLVADFAQESFSESFTHYLRKVRALVEGRGPTFSLRVDPRIPAWASN